MVSITIDGPSGAGKSTIAEILAQKLGFHHLNTGALYRAVTYGCIQEGIMADDEQGVTDYLKNCDLKVTFQDGEQKVHIKGEDVTPFLRSNIVSTKTPMYSVNMAVREGLTNYFRQLSNEINLVLDGRDIGSYVLPNATYKFYLDASVLERARRRYKELLAQGETISMKELTKQIEERDRFDKAKKIAPLVVPKNAIIIDSTHLNIEQTVDEMLKHIKI